MWLREADLSNEPFSSLPLAISTNGSEIVPISAQNPNGSYTSKRITLGTLQASAANIPATFGFIATGAGSYGAARKLTVTAGDLTATDGGSGGNFNLDLAVSGVTAASYGGATAIPVLAVDNKGRITSASTVVPQPPQQNILTTGSVGTLPNARGLTVTSTDLVATDGGAGATLNLGLQTTAVTAGTYGSAATVPIFTVDAKGRIVNATTASLATLSPPQNRLTLSGGTPVLTATVSQASTLYYTPYLGNECPLPTGAATMAMTTVNEISLGISGISIGNNYDVFVYLVGTTPTLFIGPSWATGGGNSTTRGAGAGSTQLQRFFGFWTNQYAMTSGPGANQGLYVGTIRCDPSGPTVTFNQGSAVSGGGQAFIGLWNMYNRVQFRIKVTDTNNWTYATAAWRSVDGNSNNAFFFVNGMNDSPTGAQYYASWYPAVSGGTSSVSIALDATTSPATNSTSSFGEGTGVTTVFQLVAAFSGYTGLGYHVLAPIEFGDGTNANLTTGTRGGLIADWWG